jgi:hypothetical protein
MSQIISRPDTTAVLVRLGAVWAAAKPEMAEAKTAHGSNLLTRPNIDSLLTSFDLFEGIGSNAGRPV